MNSAVRYCNQKHLRALEQVKANKKVYAAFSELEQEIKKLSPMQQLRLYSATSTFLESLIAQPKNIVNPLDVFVCQCDSIIGSKNTSFNTLVLGLAVIALTLSVALIALSAGVGVGILAGCWQSSALFLSALSIGTTSSVGVASGSTALGLGAGILSSYQFFKEPKINKVLSGCVDAVKITDAPWEQDEPALVA